MLNLEERALKDKFLLESGRPDWTDADFQSVLYSNQSAFESIQQLPFKVACPKSFTSEQLLGIQKIVTPIMNAVNAQLSEREIKIANFTTFSASKITKSGLEFIAPLLAGIGIGVAVAQWL